VTLTSVLVVMLVTVLSVVVGGVIVGYVDSTVDEGSVVVGSGTEDEEEDAPPQPLLSMLNGNEYWNRPASPTEVILMP